MGQASSHEKRKRSKKGVKGGLDDREVPRRKSSINKHGKGNITKGNKKVKVCSSNHGEDSKQQLNKQQKQQKQRPSKKELVAELGNRVHTVMDSESPRYGIFDDLKPAVCIDEDGVSLSSVSSDEDMTPRRSTPSKHTHRSSSRRLRRTYSSGRRRSRAARLAKKGHKPRSSDGPSKENSHNDVRAQSDGTVCSQHAQSECYALGREDLTAVVSGDDSGCSTLEDHLFPDDSLSDEVLGCLVTRGVELDSDTSCHSLTPISKSRRDEGYESLQKIAQGPNQPAVFGSSLAEVRQLILSTSEETYVSSADVIASVDNHDSSADIHDSLADIHDSSTVTHDSSADTGMDTSHWTLRKSSPSDEGRRSTSVNSESAQTVNSPHGQSSCGDSFSDSGYSSKAKLSECETEIAGKFESCRSSLEYSEERIDWLEGPPACVDDSFNAHFARVLGLPKTFLFYQGYENSQLQTGQAVPGEGGDSLETGGCDTSVRSGSPSGVSQGAATSTSGTDVRLRDSREPNPSEVYV